MPVIARVEGGILSLRMTGSYTPADIRAALLAATAETRGELVGMLFDVRHSEVLHTRAAGEVREMARFLGAEGDRFGRRIAMIATADYAYGLMRMGGVTAEEGGVEAAVFRSEAEARAWLDPRAAPRED